MMADLVLIRHGPTDWNAEKRLQGRTDRPLSDEGRKLVSSWQMPTRFAGFSWVSSPLQRAVETASLVAGRAVSIDQSLIETSFGDWDGRKLADLRAELGQEMAINEARGLDFQPPGGESPRIVIERLKGFWQNLSESGAATVAVCHNGVIRATYAAATGWDMKNKPETKLRNGHAHHFRIDTEGHPRVVELNISLETET